MRHHHPQHEQNKWFIKLYATIIISIAILFIALLNSCSPVGKLARLEHRHPFYVAEFCANKYPNHDSITTEVVYKQGATIFDTSYVQVDCDSAIKFNTRYVNVPKFIQKLRVDTFTQSVTKVIKSGAELKQIAILQNDNEKLKDSRNWWMKVAIGLSIATVLSLAAKIYFK